MDVRRFVLAQTSRYTQAVRKLLSIKGEEHDVSYGVHLEDERPEHSFLKGETLWAQFNSATGAAGTRAFFGVSNPAASTQLVIIESALVYAAAANVVIDTGIDFAEITTAAASMKPRDLRRRTAAATTARAVGGATAVITAGILLQHTTLAANDIVDVLTRAGRVGPIVLPPNSVFLIWTDAQGVNTISGTISGYERPLESGELIA